MRKPFYYPKRFWFWKPQLSFGPLVFKGHDEYAREVLMLGFGFTGRLLVATKDCDQSNDDCTKSRILRERLIKHAKMNSNS